VSEILRDFLVDLACDPERMQAFVANPALVVDRSALSPNERTAILSRDGRAIRSAMGLAPGTAASQSFIKGPKRKPGKPPAKPKPKPKSKKTGTRKK